MSRSVKIWVGAATPIVAAIVAGLFQLYGPSRSQQTITAPEANSSPITMLGTAHDVTINYNVPDTATRDAVDSLKKKAADTDTAIELTQKELLLLSRALQDLDQRTSSLQKLPDGRTLVGDFISGTPTIVLEEHEKARRLFTAGDSSAALEYSQKAIKAYEDTKQVPHVMSSGDLSPENAGKVYMLGASIAQRLQRDELALEYATKAVETQPSAEHQAILATALFNVGKVDEAIAAINKVVDAEPNNQNYRQLRDEMLKWRLPATG